MRLLPITVTLASVLGASNAFVLPDFEQFAIDHGLALAGLNALALLNSATKYGGGCHLGNVKFRREWRTLSKWERKSYIAAVKCVMNTPSTLEPGVAPGSTNLFEDFVYVHMNQTLWIHNTGNFLTWHRWFIQVYETKLRNCGYNGALPYWEWGYDVNSPRDSPVFDGSDTSMGSDGEYIPNKPPVEHLLPLATEPIVLAPGTGGGCVYAGPFANMTTRLGPMTEPDPYQNNARCLKRDLNPDCAQRFTTFRNTTELILNSPDIKTFATTLEGDTRYVSNSLGVHGGGHFTIAGDPGSDAFISPGDPAFYLHHAQVDRVYWIWQMLDFEHRQNVFGTTVFYDLFPGTNTTVEDDIVLAPLGKTVKIKDMMNTVGTKDLCYVYI
ncbi:hypothetical protein VTK26DRAFT_7446 [Humicola hyalothermophila]